MSNYCLEQKKSESGTFAHNRVTSFQKLAPEVGLEPTTSRLTAARSTIELLWN